MFGPSKRLGSHQERSSPECAASTLVITAPSKSPSLQYGEYILSYQDCRACHGDKLTGGVPGQLAPLGPDLIL
jgi:hypothetical protein